MPENRLVGVSIEWTEEQRKLISQISKEVTGAILGVSTSAPKVDHEYTGTKASNEDRKLVEILYETNVDLANRIQKSPEVKQDIEKRVAARTFGPSIGSLGLGAPAQGSLKLNVNQQGLLQGLGFQGLIASAAAW
jgi:hypothetical protein